MRNQQKVLENMPARLATFYNEHIGRVREGIETYFPHHFSRELFEQTAGLVELYEQDYDTMYQSIMRPVQDYLDRSGKVLRPVLVAMTLKAYGTDPHALPRFLGSIELMEDSSIMMDDYIDGSELRRGGPCAHIAHGFAMANISSCTAFCMAHHLFYNNLMRLPIDKSNRIMNAFAWEHIQMGFGQIEELYWTESDVNNVTVDEYLQETIARCAFLSFRGPLRYAGIIANAPEEDIPVLETLGDHFLIGYHIRGDNLDMSPDSAEWGKIAGEDITTGRRTLLINYVLSKADKDDRDWLEGILNARSTDDEIKHRVFALVEKYGGFEYTAEMAERHNKAAKECIEKLHISDEDKALFIEFSDYASHKRVA